MMNVNDITPFTVCEAINSAKEDVRNGLFDVFTAKLERLACFIRSNDLSASESAELLDSEIEKMRAQQRGEL